MDKAECTDEVHRLLEEADVVEDGEQQRSLLRSANTLAENCVRLNPDNVTAWCAAGLAAYHSIGVDPDPGLHNRVERYLTRALELDEDHQFARLFLGHEYYDEGKYDMALSHFERVAQPYFVGIKQEWRALKIRELILCCKLRLGYPVSISSIRKVIDDTVQGWPEDAMLPWELAATIAQTKDSKIWRNINRTEVVRLFLYLVKQLNLHGCLADYIAEF
jgi:tetratricopeptide (TPR) repeat protein